MKRKNDKRSKLAELGGWYGAGAILLAYVLVSFSIISPQGWTYQLLNLTGALGVLVISYTKRARQPALLNLVWAVIAFVAIIGLVIK
jgi:Na+/H+ antiporter NhaD/arsenite permease-like protein